MYPRAKSRPAAMAAGALIGVAMALMLLPQTRNTAMTQVALAFGYRPEWLRAPYTGRDGSLEPRIRRVLAAQPENEELQIGAALLPVPVPHSRPNTRAELAERRRLYPGLIIDRLDEVARRFPDSPAVRAHQLRYMCRAEISLQRPELREVTGSTRSFDPSQSAPSPAALQAFRRAAEAGSRLEPGNGFFDTMLAVAAFAARQDQAALQHLRDAAAKPEWNDYHGQERQAQWALLEAAYGPRGWLQKFPGALFGILSESHYWPIQSAGHLALWHAWQREKAGDAAGVRTIRGDLMRLAQRMRERDGALRTGLVLFDAASRHVPQDNGPWRIFDHQKLREHLRAPYIRYLREHGETAEAEWVQAEVPRVDAGWVRVNRWDRESGERHGRWEVWLGAGWGAGLLFCRQIAVLLALWAAAALLARSGRRDDGASDSEAALWPVFCLALFLMPLGVVAIIGPGYRWPGSFEAAVAAAALVLLGAGWLYRREAGEPGSAGVVPALYLLVGLTPLALVALFGPVHLLWGYLWGVLQVALLAAARWAGRHTADTEAEPGWSPPLVAFVTVAATVLGAALVAPLLAKPGGLLTVLQVLPLADEDGGRGSIAPLVVLLPAWLLTFWQLCRVAALDLPLWRGLGRGLRQTTPYALVLLALLYLVALVPTVAAERVIEQRIVRSVAGESL